METKHILQTGNIATQTEIEETLLGLSDAQSGDLFLGRDEQLSLAYKQRAKRVAYALDKNSEKLQEAS